MTGRDEPSWQPIGGLPVIASLIDGGLRDGREHYATLLEARPKASIGKVMRPRKRSITVARRLDESGHSVLPWVPAHRVPGAQPRRP